MPAKTKTMSATEVQNRFGQMLQMVARGETVVVTRHGAPQAVILSPEEYAELAQAGVHGLGHLTQEFDALLDRLQEPPARRGLQLAFSATEEELADAGLSAMKRELDE